MTNRQGLKGHDTRIACAFALAILSCGLGLALCFIKSPQAKSADYLAISRQALATDSDLALSAAYEAARLNPSSAQVWLTLSKVLQHKGYDNTARKAQTIALRLHKNPDDPALLYAMPADLRLSFLAEAGGDL